MIWIICQPLFSQCANELVANETWTASPCVEVRSGASFQLCSAPSCAPQLSISPVSRTEEYTNITHARSTHIHVLHRPACEQLRTDSNCATRLIVRLQSLPWEMHCWEVGWAQAIMEWEAAVRVVWIGSWLKSAYPRIILLLRRDAVF